MLSLCVYYHLCGWYWLVSSLERFLPRQAEIANLEDTVGVDEQVARLYVSVNDFCWMKIRDAAKDLVQEDLDVVRGEVLRWHDDLVKVRLHQLRDHVDLLEEVQMRRLKRKEDGYGSNLELKGSFTRCSFDICSSGSELCCHRDNIFSNFLQCNSRCSHKHQTHVVWTRQAVNKRGEMFQLSFYFPFSDKLPRYSNNLVLNTFGL